MLNFCLYVKIKRLKFEHLKFVKKFLELHMSFISIRKKREKGIERERRIGLYYDCCFIITTMIDLYRTI